MRKADLVAAISEKTLNIIFLLLSQLRYLLNRSKEM